MHQGVQSPLEWFCGGKEEEEESATEEREGGETDYLEDGAGRGQPESKWDTPRLPAGGVRNREVEDEESGVGTAVRGMGFRAAATMDRAGFARALAAFVAAPLLGGALCGSGGVVPAAEAVSARMAEDTLFAMFHASGVSQSTTRAARVIRS